MSSIRRIQNIIVGILTLIGSMIILIDSENGYFWVVLMIDITLLFYGIRMLIYYFTMARFMVGGIMTLYKSIIAIDFGVFMFGLDDTPRRLTMLYLIGIMIFNGIVSLLTAVDSKRMQTSFWKYRFAYGIVRIAFALICLIFWDSDQMVTLIYSIGLIHAGLYRIASSFHRTAIIHIGT